MTSRVGSNSMEFERDWIRREGKIKPISSGIKKQLLARAGLIPGVFKVNKNNAGRLKQQRRSRSKRDRGEFFIILSHFRLSLSISFPSLYRFQISIFLMLGSRSQDSLQLAKVCIILIASSISSPVSYKKLRSYSYGWIVSCVIVPKFLIFLDTAFCS